MVNKNSMHLYVYLLKVQYELEIFENEQQLVS